MQREDRLHHCLPAQQDYYDDDGCKNWRPLNYVAKLDNVWCDGHPKIAQNYGNGNYSGEDNNASNDDSSSDRCCPLGQKHESTTMRYNATGGPTSPLPTGAAVQRERKKGRDDDNDVDYDGGAHRRPSDQIANDDNDEGDDPRRLSEQCRDK